MYPEENEICCVEKAEPTVTNFLHENRKIIEEIIIISKRNLGLLNGNGETSESSKEPASILQDLAIQNDNLKFIRRIVSETAEMLGK